MGVRGISSAGGSGGGGSGTVTGASSEGTGSPVYDSGSSTAANLVFRSLAVAGTGLAIASSGGTITITGSGGGVNPSFTVTKPTASGNVNPSTSAWASGTGNTQTLVAGASGNQYRVSNINAQGGANITIAVPAGTSLNGTTNGTQVAVPGSSYTIETDGTNFILV